MGRLTATAAMAVMLLARPATAGADERAAGVAIDAAHARVTFTVTHIYVQHVTGTVPLVAGTITLPPGGTVPTAVSATFDATRVETGDQDRDADLQGPDWFDTKRFPAWTFVSTAITPGTGGAFLVDGTLTVHGVAQPVRLTATTTRGLPHPAYHATATLDRHAFAMRRTPIDGLIGNDVAIALDVATR